MIIRKIPDHKHLRGPLDGCESGLLAMSWGGVYLGLYLYAESSVAAFRSAENWTRLCEARQLVATGCHRLRQTLTWVQQCCSAFRSV